MQILAVVVPEWILKKLAFLSDRFDFLSTSSEGYDDYFNSSDEFV